MNRDSLTEAVGYIDPAYVEEADVQGEAKLGRRWKRPALIAACLCLVLAGTALAAELAGVHVSDFFEGRDTDEEGIEFDFLGYNFHVNGIKRIPADSLEPGILEHIEETRHSDGFYIINKALQSEEEAEEFLGLDLPDNLALERAYGGTISMGVGDVVGTDGSGQDDIQYIGSPSWVQLRGFSEVPQDIGVTLAYRFHWPEWTAESEDSWKTWTDFLPVYLEATIYTDENSAALEEEGIGSESRFRQNEYAVWTALDKYSYTTPSGLETAIMVTCSSGEDDIGEETAYWYDAYFVLEGIFYHIWIHDSDEAIARGAMEEILDGFVYEAPAQP